MQGVNIDTIRVFETDFGLLHIDDELRILNLHEFTGPNGTAAKEQFYRWVNQAITAYMQPVPKRSWWQRLWSRS